MVSRVLAILAIVIAAAGATSVPSNAAPQAAQNPEVLQALLVEVRGLRTAMEQMAAAGPRVQLAFGRLQLQEQRINGLTRRMETVREKILPAMRDDEQLRARVKTFEGIVSGVPGDSPEERRQAELELAAVKRSAARAALELQRLQTEEIDIANEIAVEQGRWMQINQALEDLERALARPVK